MIRTLPTYLFLFLNLGLSAQSTLSGTVTDESGEPLIGANIYLKDTYDGATTNADGWFSFETYEEGSQILVVSFIGFVTHQEALTIAGDRKFVISLRESFNSIDAVTISAGSFEASDTKKAVVLKSLDIAMTAGATADITGALNTLPGTQTVGESGRLFVRGGTSEETKIYIDGAEASNYYGTSSNNIPTRSRFSPFLFKGTFFSTGGYSAEYGQALSSALILNTLDPEPLNEVNISLMSVGGDVSINRGTNDQSVYAKIGYTNLNPYNELIDQRIDWIRGSVSWDGIATYKRQFDNGASVKVLAMGNSSGFELNQSTILNEQGYNHIKISNENIYGTANAELPVGEKDFLYLGVSNNWNRDDAAIDGMKTTEPVHNRHLKAKYVREISEKSNLNSGVEVFHERYDSKFSFADSSETNPGYSSLTYAGYSELDQYLSEQWMIRVGVRGEYDDLLEEFHLSPRFSMAHKLSEYEQVSFASGWYNQKPNREYLRFSDDLRQQQAAHYILNYQRIKKDRVFRVETYYKGYDRLITFSDAFDPESYRSDGEGYAYGLDVFWRDRGGIKNLDYWVSYSWLKSERLFRDFPVKSTPGFSSAHNLSLVVKRWFPGLKSQMGMTYSFTSGRPYENPNMDGFNESLTRAYHDLSYNVAVLPTANVIVYFSATNLLGADQVFGYNFGPVADAEGRYPSEAIRLPAKRFVFLGCFITIGSFNKQLNNL